MAGYLHQSQREGGRCASSAIPQRSKPTRWGIPVTSRKPVPEVLRWPNIDWTPKPNQFFKEATVPGELLNVDFMVKDSKRFADSGGWGYAVFDYNAASDTFTPGTTAGTPPQGNDAKCGFACHTRAKARDYVFNGGPEAVIAD